MEITVLIGRLNITFISIAILIGIISGSLIYCILRNRHKTRLCSRLGTNNVGLLVGKMEGGKIEDCYANGTITIIGSEDGINAGIIGSASQNAQIKNVGGRVNINISKKNLNLLERHPIITSLFFGTIASLIASVLFAILPVFKRFRV